LHRKAAVGDTASRSYPTVVPYESPRQLGGAGEEPTAEPEGFHVIGWPPDERLLSRTGRYGGGRPRSVRRALPRRSATCCRSPNHRRHTSQDRCAPTSSSSCSDVLLKILPRRPPSASSLRDSLLACEDASRYDRTKALAWWRDHRAKVHAGTAPSAARSPATIAVDLRGRSSPKTAETRVD
jgi:hypothetical protein